MKAYEDKHIGEKYGKWTLIFRDQTKIRPAKYLCRCDCGNEQIVFFSNIRSGKSSNCMDCQSKKKSDHLIGETFEDITILGSEKIDGKVKLLIKCKCGNTRYISNRITRGINTKCSFACRKEYVPRFCRVIGNKYGMLTVLDKLLERQTYLCRCDCGKQLEVKYHKFQTQFPSCGCYRKKLNIENAKKLEGKTYFYLTVKKFLGMGEDKRARYLVKCKCGTIFEEEIKHLFGSKSCGCLQRQNAAKGSKCGTSKIHEDSVRSIKELFRTGYYTRKEIAEMFGLNFYHICSIISGKSWKHVT